MEQINWRISPAATLAKYLFTTQTEPSVLPPEWQSVMPRISENASKLGISAAAFSSSSRFVDALEPLITSNRLPQLFAGIAEPITEQITNEVSLRTSQLKHHWLVRGPGFLELLEQILSAFQLCGSRFMDHYSGQTGRPGDSPNVAGGKLSCSFVYRFVA